MHLRHQAAFRSVRRLLSGRTARSEFDVVIAGGGVIGSSVAYHLAMSAPELKVAVVERDPNGSFSSAPRSAGGIRQQFSLKENIELSLYGLNLLRSAATTLRTSDSTPDVQLKEQGYLFLATESGVDVLKANHATQQRCGASTTLLGPEALAQRFPWLKLDGIALGCFGEEGEGWFDPWALVTALRRRAIEEGVTYLHGDVHGLSVRPAPASLDGADSTARVHIEDVHVRDASGGAFSIGCGQLVNAAGAFASNIVSFCGSPDLVAPLPVAARRRSIFSVRTSLADAGGDVPITVPPNDTTPLVVDPSGVYFRPEGGVGQFICGVSPPAEFGDPDCNDSAALEEVDHALFDAVIWPAMYERVEAFGALKVQSAWSGFYEYNTLDQNCIIGKHPHVSNLILCNGFSGHGLQQAPGAGRAVAELITTGGYRTVDVSCFGFERVLNEEPLFEKNIV